MILNHHTLHRWLVEIRPLIELARIVDCFSQVKDVLHIGVVDSHRKTWTIEVSAESSQPHILLRKEYERRSKNSVGLLESAHRRRIVSAVLDGEDRIIRLELDDDRRLCIELFGSINVFLVGIDGSIEDSFKDPRQWVGRPYLDARANLKRESIDLFNTRLDTVTAITEKLAQGALHFNKPLTLEFLHACGDDQDMDRARSCLRDLLERLRTSHPRVYYVQGIPKLFSIISLSHFREREESRGRTVVEKLFESVNDGIETYVAERRRADRLEETATVLIKAYRTRIRRLETLELALENDRQKASRHADHERFAHLLANHAGELQRGMSSIELTDDFSEGGNAVTIRLEPQLSPQENIAKYFSVAKKLKTSLRKIEERVRTVSKERQQMAMELAAIESGEFTEKHLQELHRRFVREGWIQKVPHGRARKSADDDEPMSFREYRVHGGWMVYVGQNERKNDLLTFRFAKKNDLWFHARGVPGSHVVLRRAGRSDNPGKLALEQTASLAAFFSKGNTSSLVPVSYAERKYVRKPKGALPGQVILEREEVIIVPPQEPPEAQLAIDNQNDIA